MSELSSKSRTLLDAARLARPSSAASARMNAALIAAIGVPPPIAPGPAPVPPVAPAPLAGAVAAGSTVKAMVIGALLGVITVGGAAAWPTRSLPSSRAQPAAVDTSRAPVVENTTPPSIVEPVPSSTPVALAEPPRAAPLAPTSRVAASARPRALDANEEPLSPPTAVSISEETALLREAQRSLKQGDGARAIAVLDDLAARHPAGVLREERLAARVFALCAAGQIDDAREAGQRFLAEMPSSVQADRVRASCASSPNKKP